MFLTLFIFIVIRHILWKYFAITQYYFISYLFCQNQINITLIKYFKIYSIGYFVLIALNVECTFIIFVLFRTVFDIVFDLYYIANANFISQCFFRTKVFINYIYRNFRSQFSHILAFQFYQQNHQNQVFEFYLPPPPPPFILQFARKRKFIWSLFPGN